MVWKGAEGWETLSEKHAEEGVRRKEPENVRWQD